MAEHPIIFSTEMVRAILDGRKTQTRRIIKEIPAYYVLGNRPKSYEEHEYAFLDMADPIGTYPTYTKCPYGQVGDTLWVREALYCDEKGHFGRYKADNKPVGGELPLVWCWKTKHLSGRFMPKIQARIFLEITNIRVERVQDITLEDVIAEGIKDVNKCVYNDDNVFKCDHHDTVNKFKKLWDSLNAKRGYGWDKNPFVWCIEFKRFT